MIATLFSSVKFGGGMRLPHIRVKHFDVFASVLPDCVAENKQPGPQR